MLNLGSQVKVIFSFRLIEPFRHHIKQQFKLVSLNLDFSTVHCIYELNLINVAITSHIRRSQTLLKRNLSIWECNCTNFIDNFLRSLEANLLVELNFFPKVLLHQIDLYYTSLVWIELTHNIFNFIVMEMYI
jgi:hypothetical protein